VDLYEVSPMLAFIPLLFVVILVHFFIKSDRTVLLQAVERSEQERLAKVAPKFVPLGGADGNPSLDAPEDDSSDSGDNNEAARTENVDNEGTGIGRENDETGEHVVVGAGSGGRSSDSGSSRDSVSSDSNGSSSNSGSDSSGESSGSSSSFDDQYLTYEEQLRGILSEEEEWGIDDYYMDEVEYVATLPSP